jgi:cobalt-precorrin-7 (C5)-methyltransferase
MIVLGVGCGPRMLTQEAITVLAGSSLVYGSPRSLEMVREFLPPGCVEREIEDYSNMGSIPEKAVVLSTGDPMLAGLGKHADTVVPGISSLQVAFARLKLDLCLISVVNAHGRNAEEATSEAVEEVRRGKNVFMLAQPSYDVQMLADALLRNAMNCHIAVCEDLGYENERIAVGTASDPPVARSKLFSLVMWPAT